MLRKVTRNFDFRYLIFGLFLFVCLIFFLLQTGFNTYPSHESVSESRRIVVKYFISNQLRIDVTEQKDVVTFNNNNSFVLNA